jgi:uncharacterized protein DUF397
MALSRIAWCKSSRSGGNGGSCVEVGVWRKCSHSGSGGEDCLEVATTAANTSELLLVRDSKDPAGPKLGFSGSEWTTFLAQIKSGSLNLAN